MESAHGSQGTPIGRLIDHTLLRPEATREQIVRLRADLLHGV